MKIISGRGSVCERKESKRDKEKVGMKTWRDMQTWDESHVYIQLPLTQSHPYLHTKGMTAVTHLQHIMLFLQT